MLKQSDGLLIHQLRHLREKKELVNHRPVFRTSEVFSAHHIRQHRADSIEPLVSLADVLQTEVVQQDFLHDENRHRLAQLAAGLHDAQAQRDDLGREQEVDNVGAVVLDERADHAERRQAQVFEGARLGGRVEEGVEEEGDVCW